MSIRAEVADGARPRTVFALLGIAVAASVAMVVLAFASVGGWALAAVATAQLLSLISTAVAVVPRRRSDISAPADGLGARLAAHTVTIAASVTPDDVARHTALALADVTGSHTVTVWAPMDHGALRVSHSSDLSVSTGDRQRRGEGLASMAWERRSIEEMTTAQGGRLAVPMIAGDECAGVVELTVPAWPLADDLTDAVRTLAAHGATATAAAQLRARAAELANVDPLSGLPDARRFDEDLAAALEAADRAEASALLVLAVDHFASHVDRHGHPAGDTIIREVGALLHDTLRSSDTAYRCEAATFGIILRGAGAQAAASLAERLRQLIARRFLTDGVTASCGVAVAPDTATDADGLREAAREALFDAARLGRNRVVIAAAIESELRLARLNAAGI